MSDYKGQAARGAGTHAHAVGKTLERLSQQLARAMQRLSRPTAEQQQAREKFAAQRDAVRLAEGLNPHGGAPRSPTNDPRTSPLARDDVVDVSNRLNQYGDDHW